MIYQAGARGREIILVMHSPNHVYEIGECGTILHQGASCGTCGKDELGLDHTATMMEGGE